MASVEFLESIRRHEEIYRYRQACNNLYALGNRVLAPYPRRGALPHKEAPLIPTNLNGKIVFVQLREIVTRASGFNGTVAAYRRFTDGEHQYFISGVAIQQRDDTSSSPQVVALVEPSYISLGKVKLEPPNHGFEAVGIIERLFDSMQEHLKP